MISYQHIVIMQKQRYNYHSVQYNTIFVYYSNLHVLHMFAVNCTSEQFTCPSGLCLPTNRLCDGLYDCATFDDELECGENDLCAFMRTK